MALCQPHKRAGIFVSATRVVDGEPFCEECFDGEPICPSQIVLDVELHEERRRREAGEKDAARPRRRPPAPRSDRDPARPSARITRIRRTFEKLDRRVDDVGAREHLWPAGPRLVPERPAVLKRELTPKETRVCELVRAGWENRQIAAELGISVRGVKYHLSNIYSKRGLGKGRAPRYRLIAGWTEESAHAEEAERQSAAG